MEPQPHLGVETLLPCQGVVAVHHAERFQAITVSLRKARRDLYKLTSSVGIQFASRIFTPFVDLGVFRDSASHILDRRTLLRAPPQQAGEVLTRMLLAR